MTSHDDYILFIRKRDDTKTFSGGKTGENEHSEEAEVMTSNPHSPETLC